MRTPSEDNTAQTNTANPNDTSDASQPDAAATGNEWAAHLELLEGLAQLVHQEKLSEIEIEQDGVRMTLRSISAVPPTAMSPGAAIPGVASQYDADWYIAADEAPVPDVMATSESTNSHLIPVVAPMVGMFYRAQSPDDPPFVEVGDHIEAGHIIGLVEAMKTFNEIQSDSSGTVREIVAANGALVETGATLILIEKG